MLQMQVLKKLLHEKTSILRIALFRADQDHQNNNGTCAFLAV